MDNDTEHGRSPDGSGSRPSDGAQGVSTVPASIPNAFVELAERCEQAERPDRELDCLIHCAVKGWRVVYEGKNVFADMGEGMRRVLVGWLDPGKEQRNFCLTSDSLAPHYTASFDAAMTLLAPRTLWAVGSMEDGPFARLCWPMPGGTYGGGCVEGQAENAFLSLCAAALRGHAIATEARRVETSSGSVHEGAGLQGIAQPQSVSGLSHTGVDRG